MKLSLMLIACVATLLSTGASSSAQTTLPAETRNAALRYWQAMSDLREPSSDSSEQSLLRQTEGGFQPWDGSKLGSILDANKDAIEEMQRATKLPECDWGLEYSRGARASVTHQVMQARELARLNTLYGMRLMAKGQSQEALDAWLDGVKFGHDLGNGGPVILQLMGREVLLPDLQALTAAANSGKFSAQQKAQIASTIGALTPDVFDWSDAFGLEEAAGEIFLNEIRIAKDPAVAYREVAGSAMPAQFKGPSEAEIVAFRSLIAQAEAELRMPPADAQAPLEKLQLQIENSKRELAWTVPSLLQINKARAEVVAARETLLKALGS